MVNGAALNDLNDFLTSPQATRLTRLLSIPGLYRVLKTLPTITSFVPVLQWLARRATAVLRELSVEPVPLSSGAISGVRDSDWKVVSE